ncbi:MAG: hypothetical protein ACE5KE_00675 [Methanosarcinales archaeon]
MNEVNYREAAEGLMDSLPNLLVRRTHLLKKKGIDRGMVLGGDKYLRKWLKIRKEVSYGKWGGVKVNLYNVPKEVLEVFKKEEKVFERGATPSQYFEDMVYSLQQIYRLPKDVLESSFWTEGI